MIRVLALVGCYLPGFKGGGPIRSLSNMVRHLCDTVAFRVITTDRDLGDTQPYVGIPSDTWMEVAGAQVWYGSAGNFSSQRTRVLMKSEQYDVLYLNSFFSPAFAVQPLLLRRLRQVPCIPTVVAPRGEFSPGALAIKRLKKAAYLAFAKAIGLCDGVIWQATSEPEAADIRRIFGPRAKIIIAGNLPAVAPALPPHVTGRVKTPGSLRVMFISRISRKKNLDAALRMLAPLSGTVTFNIYGPIEDSAYWAECQSHIARLPVNIQVHYCGAIAHEHVMASIAEHDLFLFPTHGENFGHVIAEALTAGCPVLLSDQTPWRQLAEAGVGWDLPLNRTEAFVSVLQQCVDMDDDKLRRYRTRAREYGAAQSQVPQAVAQTRTLFQKALQEGVTP